MTGGWLYANSVPGSASGGMVKKPRTGSAGSIVAASRNVSRSWPDAIEAMWRIRIRRVIGSASPKHSGRCSLTRSSNDSRPSPSWSPRAVPVNVLLSEYTRRSWPGRCGAQ